MLTLDSQKLARQREVARFREHQHRSREALLDAIERKSITVAPDGDIVTTDFEQQVGQPLSSAEFVRRLQLMNRDLIAEPTITDATKMGIYVVRNAEKIFLCGMERGFMPERSVRHMKRDRMPDPDALNKGGWVDVDVFTKETRGWRTVLARLLRFRMITEAQISQHFPANLNSRNWQVLTT